MVGLFNDYWRYLPQLRSSKTGAPADARIGRSQVVTRVVTRGGATDHPTDLKWLVTLGISYAPLKKITSYNML